jgi:pimeloyl-ACP methyl ester carboxylesterase
MTDLTEHEAALIDAFFMRFGTPKRRARPRIAARLVDTEHQMIATPGGAVAAWRLPGPAPVLLVHGWEDDNSLWQNLIEAIDFVGRGVVAFDLPGHGYSEGATLNMDLGAAAVRAVADAMGPFDAVVTHSFGGPASVLALEGGLAIARAVLIAPPMALELSIARNVARVGAGPHVAAAIAARIAAQSPNGLAYYDMRRSAPAMRARALFVHSIDDPETDFQNSRTLADLWPDAQLLLTDGMGHRAIAMDASIIARIVEFLEAA